MYVLGVSCCDVYVFCVCLEVVQPCLFGCLDQLLTIQKEAIPILKTNWNKSTFVLKDKDVYKDSNTFLYRLFIIGHKSDYDCNAIIGIVGADENLYQMNFENKTWNGISDLTQSTTHKNGEMQHFYNENVVDLIGQKGNLSHYSVTPIDLKITICQSHLTMQFYSFKTENEAKIENIQMNQSGYCLQIDTWVPKIEIQCFKIPRHWYQKWSNIFDFVFISQKSKWNGFRKFNEQCNFFYKLPFELNYLGLLPFNE